MITAGPGIPESQRRHLQSEQPIDQLSHDRGLGLDFVDWVAPFSNGRLTFEQREDGTVARIVLMAAGDI